MEVDLHDHVCDSWIERTDTLDQRYERLAQVAKEAMQYIEYLELRHDAQPTSRKAQMYQQLKALGVSVDD